MEVALWDGLPAQLSWKEKIAYLAVSLMDAFPNAPQLPVDHCIGHGAYIRKIYIPAHTIFLGREHLKGHDLTLMKGEAILILPDGEKRLYKAVTSMRSEPGFHTVAYMLSPVEVWTFHPNPQHLQDTKALEEQIFGPVSDVVKLGRSIQSRLISA